MWGSVLGPLIFGNSHLNSKTRGAESREGCACGLWPSLDSTRGGLRILLVRFHVSHGQNSQYGDYTGVVWDPSLLQGDQASYNGLYYTLAVFLA